MKVKRYTGENDYELGVRKVFLKNTEVQIKMGIKLLKVKNYVIKDNFMNKVKKTSQRLEEWIFF